MCLISVVMGAYNIGALPVFDQAMRSVLNQTVGQIEFLICDDGSTDDTYSILCQYAREDTRIRILRNKTRKGLAFSLNKCIKAARGNYIARQDADDISDPKRFQKQIAFLETHPKIGFVGSNVALYDASGCWGKRILPSYPKEEDFLFTDPFVHGTLLFRKEIFQISGLYRVAKETQRAEDYDLLMGMYALGIQGANLKECLYQYLEDTDTWRRRKYRYRLDEAKVRFKGFRRLGLLPKGFPYVIKPLVVGLIPAAILLRLKNGYTIQS